MQVEKLKEMLELLNAEKATVSCDKVTAKIIKSDADLAERCEIIENYHCRFRDVYIVDFVKNDG